MLFRHVLGFCVVLTPPGPCSGRSFRPPSVSARFFIIKSYNHQNIGQSISTGVWATQAHNECKLAQAFGDGDGEVLLVFSVNGSGHFQGYARMETPIGRAKGRWTGDAGALGGTFGIQWECLYDLPFSATSHMCNPLNEGKPIKISRDGTELPADIGVQLVNLFEAGAQQAGLPRPKPRPHVEWEQPRGEPRGGARAPQPQPPQQQQQRSPESAPEAEEQGKSRRDRKRGSRSRSRSRDRHRKHSSRKRRSRSREGDGDAAQREYLEYCAHYMRTQGWDGRGGEEGMTRFWNAYMQGGGGGPPGGGWGAPPQGAWGGHGWGAWGGGGGRGRGWGGGGPGWR